MPRQSRIDAPGALRHLIVRGIERRKIFRDNQDRYCSINRLDLILEETATACYAWALIPHHLHLLLRTGIATIAAVMRRLITGHAIRLCYWAVQELGEQMTTLTSAWRYRRSLCANRFGMGQQLSVKTIIESN